ncbi:unnamed protein product [Rotaria sp. Silwood1]|nr:unnamed protein product [Rotaria sp. Silwood1]
MTGITVIGTDGQDKLRAVFGSIAGLFIDKQRNTLYAIDESDDGSIHMFSLDETPPMEISVGVHLYKPTLIYVDENDVNGPTMYITFPDQHRVVKWAHEAISGVTILDNCLTCTGVWLDKDKNVKNDQLSAPRDLAFDKHGHLYVSDVGNIRVQMFALIDNQPCSSTSTG